MWLPERIEFRRREFDFTSSGLGHESFTSIVADSVEIVNAVELVDIAERPIQLIVCDHCGTVGCNAGSRVDVRTLDDGIVLMPAFDAMAAGPWERDEYGPPDSVTTHGTIFFRGNALAALQERFSGFFDMRRWPPLSMVEAVHVVQHDAPGRVLGDCPDEPRLCEQLVLAVDPADRASATAALASVLSSALRDRRPAALQSAQTVAFYLDLPGTPEAHFLAVHNGTFSLALMPSVAIVPRDGPA